MTHTQRYDRLHDLPPEIFETILTYLDLESLKDLRLTNTKLAERCIGPRFLRCIQQPVLDVSPQNLRSLLALSRNPALGKKIHSLTFLATTIDSSELERNITAGDYEVVEIHGPMFEKYNVEYTPEELANAESDLVWLKEQQEARTKESPSEMIELLLLALKGFGDLDAIRFDGGVIRGRDKREPPGRKEWQSLWARASHVLSWVLAAIVQSGSSVKSLDIYRQADRCCIPVNEITTVASGLSQAQLEILGKGLQSLELSISGAIKDALGDDDEDEEEAEETEEAKKEGKEAPSGKSGSSKERNLLEDGTPGITSLFLKSAPALRELDLTFRRTGYGNKYFHCYDRIIDSIANETRLPTLENCAFSGFAAKGESLLLFLQKHPDVRSLTLHECHLTTGSWTPIFAHLERSMPQLENLSLKNLFGKHTQNMKYVQPRRRAAPNPNEQEAEDDEQEGDGMVVLLPIWDTNPPPRWTRYSHSNGQVVHTRDFTREELKKGLVFRPLDKGPGRSLGSPELMHWKRSRNQLYGPP